MNPATPISWSQVSAFRLRRHHLAQRAPRTSLVAVVRDVCGIQAQLLSAAQMALWARVRDLTSEDIERALWEQRTLVKTWCMRGTVHLLPAGDLPIYVGALKEAAVEAEERWHARLGMSPNEASAMRDAVVDALTTRPLTRRALTEKVVGRIGPNAKRWVEHGWGGVVKLAALQGAVCFGPSMGPQITFVRRDGWLPELKEMAIEDAQVILLRRYLHTYGPATFQDFAAWAGLSVKSVASIWSRLGNDVVETTVEGRVAWCLREDVAALHATRTNALAVNLLPSFDAYMLGHRAKDHFTDRAHYKRVYRKAGWLSPVILVNGRVAGVWAHERRGGRLRLRVELFRKVSVVVRDRIEAEANDLRRFLSAASNVTFV